MSPTLPIKLALAGMVDESGRLGFGLLPTNKLHIPQDVWLSENRLHWREPRGGRYGHVPTADPKGLLDEFVRIDTSEDMLHFARRFGPLRLCQKHSLPVNHGVAVQYDQERDLSYESLLECEPAGGPDEYSEPVAGWRLCILKVKALLEIGAALHEPREMEPPGAILAAIVDWRPELITAVLPYLFHIETAEFVVSFEVVTWLRMGRVRVSWSGWAGSEPFLFVGADTFGTLALQLATALSRAQSVAVCNGCGNPYLRKGRAPQSGRRNFCPRTDCKSAGNRLRVAASRRRRKADEGGR